VIKLVCKNKEVKKGMWERTRDPIFRRP